MPINELKFNKKSEFIDSLLYERSIISNSLITLSSNLFQELSSEKVAKIAEVGASSENCFLRNKTLGLGT